MNRLRHRSQDVEESYHLLLELCCCEPILQQAFSIIENVCLAHGVTATEAGRPLSDQFQQHVNRHWIPFMASAIRAAHVYGFVPWRVMMLEGGARVPEVLPPGTFRWSVEVPGSKNLALSSGHPEPPSARKREDAMLRYAVKLNPGQKDERNIRVTEWVQPNYQVNESSVMYATVASPMAYVIESYKHMQAAIKRQAHADAWNCTARLAVTHEPKEFLHEQFGKDIQSAFGDSLHERGPFGGFRATRHSDDPRDQVDDAFAGRSMNHNPAVYALPPWRHLETAPALQPCMDLPFLQSKYKYDVCSLLGIPPDMLMTAAHKLEGNSNSKNRTQGVSRVFQAKMQRVCHFLRELGQEVYRDIYGREAVFEIMPMPRLEIRDVEDLKVLFDIGVIQPQHTLELASVLLGSFKRARRSAAQGGAAIGGSPDGFKDPRGDAAEGGREGGGGGGGGGGDKGEGGSGNKPRQKGGDRPGPAAKRKEAGGE